MTGTPAARAAVRAWDSRDRYPGSSPNRSTIPCWTSITSSTVASLIQGAPFCLRPGNHGGRTAVPLAPGRPAGTGLSAGQCPPAGSVPAGQMRPARRTFVRVWPEIGDPHDAAVPVEVEEAQPGLADLPLRELDHAHRRVVLADDPPHRQVPVTGEVLGVERSEE